DTESRDALYALFKIYVVENYTSPTAFELEALSVLEVNSYIYGTCRRTEEGARIELNLYDINDKKMIIINSVGSSLTSDSIDELRKTLKYLTGKLLGIE
ncbi:MAG: hypothetical protein QG635_2114, partial [Bacteroidota bacterium]|nr:hypothetical protein [Bacteroidota bacterium]